MAVEKEAEQSGGDRLLRREAWHADHRNNRPTIRFAPEQVMKVSIVTPTYNRAALLPATIESILSQAGPEREYIIVDDGSSDDTRAVVGRYGNVVRYLFHENRGEAASTNRGWQEAIGDYFAVVSSDDPMLPGWLERCVKELDDNPALVGVYPDWTVINDAGEQIGAMTTYEYSFASMVSWLWTIPGPGTLIRRSALRDVTDLRNPSYRYASDLESWLRIGLKGEFRRIPEYLAAWRHHATSITVADRSKPRAQEMIRLAKSFFHRSDLPPSIRALENYALSRAYWIAALVVMDTHPLLSKIYLTKSYQLSPDDPLNLPPELARHPRPQFGDVVKVLKSLIEKPLRK
jgi:glycosyltransferase involved in cell wall biosynthesis